jgi:CBS-domain-containing membrane protein
MNTTVRDVMSINVVAVRENASFKEMATTLREQRFSGFPVLDHDNKVIGAVSEADLLATEALGGDVHGLFMGMRHYRQLPKAGPVTAADAESSMKTCWAPRRTSPAAGCRRRYSPSGCMSHAEQLSSP